METQKIKGLQDKQTVETFFLVKDKNVGLGKNGRPFMSVLLGDDSGTLDGRLWDRVDETSKEFDIGDIVKIKGLVQSFQNRLQLVIHKLEKPEQQAFNLEDYLPKVSKKVEDMFTELVTIVRSVQNDFLRQLMMDVLEDPEIKPKLLKAPAARSIHHAWLGGARSRYRRTAHVSRGRADPRFQHDVLAIGRGVPARQHAGRHVQQRRPGRARGCITATLRERHGGRAGRTSSATSFIT